MTEQKASGRCTRVLMLGIGEHMLRNKLSDARLRHIEYGSNLEKLIIIAYASYKNPGPLTWISENTAVKPTRLGKWLFPVEALFLSFLYIFRFRINVITTQDPFITGFIGMILKIFTRIPLDLQNHSEFYCSDNFVNEKPLQYRLFRLLGKLVLPFGDHHRVLNHDEKACYQEMGISGEKVTVLPTPVNSTRFYEDVPVDQVKKIRTLLGLENFFSIIWVGRITHAKDWPLLLKIAKELDRKRFRLVIVGDGEESQQLKQSVVEQDLSEVVITTGKIGHEQLPCYYRSCNLYLHTSLYEGYGKTIVEAMLSGLPVVSSNTGGARLIVKPDVTGIIIRDREASSFVKAINTLEKDNKVLKEMGGKARKDAAFRFERKQGVKSVCQTWHDLIK